MFLRAIVIKDLFNETEKKSRICQKFLCKTKRHHLYRLPCLTEIKLKFNFYIQDIQFIFRGIQEPINITAVIVVSLRSLLSMFLS